MKYFFTTAFALFLFVSLTAQNTWLGGNSHWHNPKKWSYGHVPTVNESVLIETGTATVLSGQSAYANRVEVYGSGGLTIEQNGSLTIDGLTSGLVHGLFTSGDISIGGRLSVKDIGSGDGINNSGSGTFLIQEGGQVSIRDIDSDGIWTNSTLINEGYLSVRNVNNHGIMNYGDIENTGNLYIQYANGGLYCWSDGNLTNRGNLTIQWVEKAIYLRSNSYGINHNSGLITIKHAYSYGIQLGNDNNTFFNLGTINIDVGDQLEGISNNDFFANYLYGAININSAYIGIVNHSDGTFQNNGEVSVGSDMAAWSIWNEGELINFSFGELATSYKWINRANSSWENEGFWHHNTAANATNDGQLINTGLIEDNQGTFPAITNDEIIARPITGTVEAGEPVENALDFSSINYHTVNGWYTSPDLTHSAGQYNVQRNWWVPNTSAVGLSEVFVSISRNSGGYDAVVGVAIPSGVSSLAVPGFSNTLTGEQTSPSLNGNLAYPNPNNGAFHLKVDQPLTGNYNIDIFDLAGKLLIQIPLLAEGQDQFPIVLDNQLNSGTYLLVVRKEKERVYQKRLFIAK